MQIYSFVDLPLSPTLNLRYLDDWDYDVELSVAAALSKYPTAAPTMNMTPSVYFVAMK